MYGLIDTKSNKLVTDGCGVPIVRTTKAGVTGIKTKNEQPLEVKLTIKDAKTSKVLYNK